MTRCTRNHQNPTKHLYSLSKKGGTEGSVRLAAEILDTFFSLLFFGIHGVSGSRVLRSLTWTFVLSCREIFSPPTEF